MKIYLKRNIIIITIGLIFGMLLISSCGKKIIDYADIEGEFYFINQTNHTIKIVNPIQEFNVVNGQTNLIKHQQGGVKTVNSSSYSDPFTYGMASKDKKILIKINNKCENATSSSEHSILNINNYVAERIGERTYKFTYTFTEADYNRAVGCP